MFCSSVAGPDPNFFPSRIQIFSIPDPHQRILSIVTLKSVSKLSEIWSVLFIPDPDPDFYPSRSRGQKGTGSRIRIRNTVFLKHFSVTFFKNWLYFPRTRWWRRCPTPSGWTRGRWRASWRIRRTRTASWLATRGAWSSSGTRRPRPPSTPSCRSSSSSPSPGRGTDSSSPRIMMGGETREN